MTSNFLTLNMNHEDASRIVTKFVQAMFQHSPIVSGLNVTFVNTYNAGLLHYASYSNLLYCDINSSNSLHNESTSQWRIEAI